MALKRVLIDQDLLPDNVIDDLNDAVYGIVSKECGENFTFSIDIFADINE